VSSDSLTAVERIKQSIARLSYKISREQSGQEACDKLEVEYQNLTKQLEILTVSK
jgi:hypothetical protein